MFYKKLIVDCAAASLIFAAMAYAFTGTLCHEWIGLAAVFLIFVHNFFNLKSWKFPRACANKIYRAGTYLLNVFLAVAIIAVLVSGAMLSDTIFDFVPAGTGLFARDLHIASAAWLFVLTVFHAGLHAPFFAGAFKKINVPATNKIVKIIFSIIVCGWGIYAFFKRAFPQKLSGEASFDMFALDDTFPQFFLDYFSIAALFFIVANLINEKIKAI